MECSRNEIVKMIGCARTQKEDNPTSSETHKGFKRLKDKWINVDAIGCFSFHRNCKGSMENCCSKCSYPTQIIR